MTWPPQEAMQRDLGEGAPELAVEAGSDKPREWFHRPHLRAFKMEGTHLGYRCAKQIHG